MKPDPINLGVIFGNRDFFPDHLVAKARQEIEEVFQSLGIGAIMLSEEDTKLGGVIADNPVTHGAAQRSRNPTSRAVISCGI